MKTTTRLLAIALALFLLLPALAACQSGTSKGAVTLDSTPFLGEYAFDFDAYLHTRGLSYAGVWSLPTVLPGLKTDGVLAQIIGAANIDREALGGSDLAEQRGIWEAQLSYYFDYYKSMYGSSFPYADKETFAPDLFGYDKTQYPSFTAFADAEARTRLGELLTLERFAEDAGVLPGDKEFDEYYDSTLTMQAYYNNMTKDSFEDYYAKVYGEHYLRYAVKYELLTDRICAYAEQHWKFLTPEVAPADKTAIDPEDYRETGTETDLVKMHIESADGTVSGDVYIRLYPEYAPLTVANFRKLVSEGFYEGLTFHRSQQGFCLQGGDPAGNGTGGSPDKIKGEFVENGVGNPLSHLSGVISMARANDPDSASSQFFFTMSDNYQSSLDGKYAAFGYVVAGWDVVKAAHALPVDTANNNKPLVTITMSGVTFAEKIPD